jgi:mono/diheme cytochrome c family protein
MRSPLFRIAPVAFALACSPSTPGWVSGADGPPPMVEPVPSSILSSGPMPAPISGGTLALTSDGLIFVASDPNADSVWIVERTGSGASAVPVLLEEGAEPGRVAIENDQLAHVALRGAGAVATIDLASKQLKGKTAVCPEPRGLAWDNLGGKVHVACADGQLVSFVPQSPAPLEKVQLDSDLRDIVVTADGIWVSRFRSAEVLLVRDGVVVSRGSLPLVRVADGSSQTTYAPNVAWRLVALETGGVAVAHQGARIDPPVDLGTMASAPDAGTRESPYGSSSPSGISCSAAVRSFVTTFDRNLGAVSTTALQGALPVDVAVGPGDFFLVATAGEERAEVVSRNTAPSTTVPCGSLQGPFPADSALMPVAVAYHHATSLLVVQEETLDGRLVQLSFGFASSGGTVSRVPLFTSRASHQGRALFHLATRGNSLACASCHPEAREDGRVWDFVPIGARRTQALRGGIIGRAPYHWEGDLPSFESLMTEVFVRRMGATFSAGEATQLAAWLDSVSALKAGPGDEAARRGRDIFMSPETRCASCHSGPFFTSGVKIDVGTGGTFKVPSLVGLRMRAPYMHDGCAATLDERFSSIDCGGGDLHGKTSHLTAEQINDLIAYLATL